MTLDATYDSALSRVRITCTCWARTATTCEVRARPGGGGARPQECWWRATPGALVSCEIVAKRFMFPLVRDQLGVVLDRRSRRSASLAGNSPAKARIGRSHGSIS